MGTSRKTLAITAIAATGLVMLTACNSGDQESTSTTGADGGLSGQLTWYSSQNPLMEEAVIEAFEAEHPNVDVQLLHLPTGELAVRYAQERTSSSGEADVITLSDPDFMVQGVEDGWWEDSTVTDEGFPADEANGGVAKVGVLPSVLSFNTEIVDDAPTSWEDVLDDEYEDKLLLVDPRNVPSYLALMQVWRDAYGDEFLEALAAQKPQLVPSVVPGNQSLGAGSGAILLPSTRISANAVVNEGGPLEVVDLNPTTGSEFYVAVANNAPNPKVASAFYEFLTSKAGQEAFNGPDGVAIREDTEGTAPMPENYIPLNEILPIAVENRAEILDLLGIE